MAHSTPGLSTPLPISGAAPRRGLVETAGMLLAITRPRILAMVAFTAAPVVAMTSAEPWRVLVAMTAICSTGCACSALNAWLERDRDSHMPRTRDRPLPSGRISPDAVLVCGLVLAGASAAALASLGGPGAAAAAALSLATVAFYALVYTAWLKPSSPASTVVGSAAGAVAPLMASAALDGAVTPLAWAMAGVVFCWTPPHFWAIAAFRREEYAAAGIPLWNVVAGNANARRRGLQWTVPLVLTSLAPVLLPGVGWGHAVGALALGGWFVHALVRAARADDPRHDRHAFRVSLAYLAGLIALTTSTALLA